MTTKCKLKSGSESALRRLVRLRADHEAAARGICKAVAEAYPVGSLIEAKLGQNYIRGEVMAHSKFWWRDPGGLTMKNVKSGKLRWVGAASDFYEVQLLSLPNESSGGTASRTPPSE